MSVNSVLTKLFYIVINLSRDQGSRLTAFELAFEGIPSCLICDDMAGALMNGKGKVGRVDAVVVGADRGECTY